MNDPLKNTFEIKLPVEIAEILPLTGRNNVYFFNNMIFCPVNDNNGKS